MLRLTGIVVWRINCGYNDGLKQCYRGMILGSRRAVAAIEFLRSAHNV